MTDREKFKALLPVIQAYANGEEIETKDSKGNWVTPSASMWFSCEAKNYRVKPRPPEPKYRPYTPEEMKSLVGKVAFHPLIGAVSLVTDWHQTGMVLIRGSYVDSKELITNNWTIDGKPCGVLLSE